MKQLLLGYALFALYSVIAVYVFYMIIMLLSHKRIIRIIKGVKYARYRELSGSEQVPPVSILVPSYNEELTIIESVRSLLNLGYPSYEVIVVNDGSTDRTLEVAVSAFELVEAPLACEQAIPTRPVRGVWRSITRRDLVVIDKANGGKADAINAGINAARYPLVCVIDADSLLEEHALTRAVLPFIEAPETVAAGGIVRIANGCTVDRGRVTEVRAPRHSLARFQVVEYLRAFLAGRVAQSWVNGLLIISGAFGLFRRDGFRQHFGGFRGHFFLGARQFGDGRRQGCLLDRGLGHWGELDAILRKAGGDIGLAKRGAEFGKAVIGRQAPEHVVVQQIPLRHGRKDPVVHGMGGGGKPQEVLHPFADLLTAVEVMVQQLLNPLRVEQAGADAPLQGLADALGADDFFGGIGDEHGGRLAFDGGHAAGQSPEKFVVMIQVHDLILMAVPYLAHQVHLLQTGFVSR